VTRRRRCRRRRRPSRRSIRVCAFVENCQHVKGPLGGQTIRLEPWQCFILVNVWGWLHTTGPLKDKRRYRKAYISVGRGNAKSTLSSALALYMLCADKEPGAEIYSAATTRDQAKIVFGDAQTMARKDKAMQKYFGLTVQQHVMTVNSTGSVFRPLATEGNVNDGLNLYVAVPGARHHGAYERHRQGHSESLRNLGAYSSPRPHPAGCGPAPWSQAGTGEDQHDLSRRRLWPQI